MALTLALGKGITSKFVYGSLIGGALGYMAGKMSESNPRSRLAKHLYRFGKELSSDPELSIDLFENDKKYSSPKKNISIMKHQKRSLIHFIKTMMIMIIKVIMIIRKVNAKKINIIKIILNFKIIMKIRKQAIIVINKKIIHTQEIMILKIIQVIMINMNQIMTF